MGKKSTEVDLGLGARTSFRKQPPRSPFLKKECVEKIREPPGKERRSF